MIKILSQKNCAKCILLEEILNNYLKGEYNKNIEYISREDNYHEFMKLARNHGIMATPALIAGDFVLMDIKQSKVEAFLKEHV